MGGPGPVRCRPDATGLERTSRRRRPSPPRRAGAPRRRRPLRRWGGRAGPRTGGRSAAGAVPADSAEGTRGPSRARAPTRIGADGGAPPPRGGGRAPRMRGGRVRPRLISRARRADGRPEPRPFSNRAFRSSRRSRRQRLFFVRTHRVERASSDNPFTCEPYFANKIQTNSLFWDSSITAKRQTEERRVAVMGYNG